MLRHYNSIARARNNDRGEGVAVVLIGLAVLGIAWLILSFVYGWITDTRDQRIEQGKRKGRAQQITTTTESREVGSYQITF